MAKEKDSGIYFKVSGHDRQLIEQKMELAHIRNMSAYIRKMCIDGYCPIDFILNQQRGCKYHITHDEHQMTCVPYNEEIYFSGHPCLPRR